jgi:4-hydroxy-2-oxoheptanedioate aldolase
MVLDGGAACVKVPYIESAEQAREMVGATKFRPFKGRRLQSLLDGEEPAPHVAEYIRRFNENHSLLLNIESTAGIAALDEILAVPGVDGIIIGPHDLTCSLDAPEDYRGPAFDAAARQILARCQAAGVSAGFHMHHADCVDDEVAWARAGANIVIHSGDISLFRQNLIKDITRLRDALGEKHGPGGEGVTV